MTSLWSLRGPFLRGIILGVVVAAALQVFNVTLGGNFHEVIVGDVYRCGQPTAPGLAEMIRCYGIRTVVNLRGDNAEDEWYWDEKRTTEGLGATMVDVGLYGKIPAAADQLQLLVDTLDHARAPILVHCYSGSDRAGLVSTLALLLRTDTDLPEARQQMGWWLGHNPFGNAACHDLLFDRYAEWLQGRTHSPARLRRWVHEVYRPELCIPDWANQHRASTR